MGQTMTRILKNTLTQSNLWGAVIPLHVFGIYSIVNLFISDVPLYWIPLTMIGLLCIEIIGVSAGLHRWASHKSFQVNDIVKTIMLWFGCLGCQGSPIFWATIHRGYHHRYSDKEKDPHNPKDGFWHSYIWWMFRLEEGDYNTKRIPDLLRDPIVLFLHKHYIPILWITNILAALISVNFWLYFIVLPALITFHKFCLQTSVVHYKNLGYRNYDTQEDSVNIPWLWPLTLGEAWHNNHHGRPGDPHIGGRHWWELDPTYWVIKVIRTN
jgi:fatty-acid desaturase